MTTDAIEWLVANGTVVVLLAVVLGGWARAQARVRRTAIAGAVCVALAIVLLPMLFGTAQVPIGWITVLMEGPSIRNVQQLYGQGAHFGGGFYDLADWLTGHDVTTLAAVVHVNLCLALINGIVFFFLAAYVLQSWWGALGFAVVYLVNLNTVHAAFSETPAILWTTHFWLGCIAAAVIDDEAHTTRRLRWLALLWLALLVWLAARLRLELLLLGGPALAVGVAKTLGWEPAVRRAAGVAARFLRTIVTGRLSVFVAVAVGFAALEFLPWSGNEVGWMVAGLRPLNLSFLTMPWWLSVFLPLGIIALFVLGTIYALRRWLAFFLLPVSSLILFKVYASASHGVFFERFRYLTFLTPVFLFIALFGFRELSDWAQRWAWPPWWKRVALLLLAMSCANWQAAGPKEVFRRRQELPGLTHAGFLLAWNQQTEVRYLLDLVARYPRCIFLAKAAQATWVADQRTGYQWVLFGGPVPRYREVPDTGGDLEHVAAQVVPAAPCVLFYRSLDCDLVRSDGCQSETQGRTALEERVLENLPYSDITEYGAHRAVIRLGVYPVAGTVTSGS
jgi:hypothetical protein